MRWVKENQSSARSRCSAGAGCCGCSRQRCVACAACASACFRGATAGCADARGELPLPTAAAFRHRSRRWWAGVVSVVTFVVLVTVWAGWTYVTFVAPAVEALALKGLRRLRTQRHALQDIDGLDLSALSDVRLGALARDGEWSVALWAVTSTGDEDSGDPLQPFVARARRHANSSATASDGDDDRDRNGMRRVAHLTCDDVLRAAPHESCVGLADPFLVRVRDANTDTTAAVGSSQSRRVCSGLHGIAADDDGTATAPYVGRDCNARNSVWYLFVEVIGAAAAAPSASSSAPDGARALHGVGRGRIGVFSARDAFGTGSGSGSATAGEVGWRYEGTALALADDQHLSFPFVVAAPDDTATPNPATDSSGGWSFYLLPQYSGTGLPLWTTSARRFPFGWTLAAHSVVAPDADGGVVSYRDSVLTRGGADSAWRLVTMPLADQHIAAYSQAQSVAVTVVATPLLLPLHAASRCLVTLTSTSGSIVGPYRVADDGDAVCTDPDRNGGSNNWHRSSETGRHELRLAGRIVALPAPADGAKGAKPPARRWVGFVQRTAPYYGAGVHVHDAGALVGGTGGDRDRRSSLPATTTRDTAADQQLQPSSQVLSASRRAGAYDALGAHTFNPHPVSDSASPDTTAWLVAVDGLALPNPQRQHQRDRWRGGRVGGGRVASSPGARVPRSAL